MPWPCRTAVAQAEDAAKPANFYFNALITESALFLFLNIAVLTFVSALKARWRSNKQRQEQMSGCAGYLLERWVLVPTLRALNGFHTIIMAALGDFCGKTNRGNIFLFHRPTLCF